MRYFYIGEGGKRNQWNDFGEKTNGHDWKYCFLIFVFVGYALSQNIFSKLHWLLIDLMLVFINETRTNITKWIFTSMQHTVHIYHSSFIFKMFNVD